MKFHAELEPQGNRSHVKITVPNLRGDGVLLLQCFENFLEYGLNSEVYNWQRDGSAVSYTLTTTGAKKAKVRLDVQICPVDDGIELKTSVTNLDTQIVDHILYNTCFAAVRPPTPKESVQTRTRIPRPHRRAHLCSR